MGIHDVDKMDRRWASRQDRRRKSDQEWRGSDLEKER